MSAVPRSFPKTRPSAPGQNRRKVLGDCFRPGRSSDCGSARSATRRRSLLQRHGAFPANAVRRSSAPMSRRDRVGLPSICRSHSLPHSIRATGLRFASGRTGCRMGDTASSKCLSGTTRSGRARRTWHPGSRPSGACFRELPALTWPPVQPILSAAQRMALRDWSPP